MLKTQILNATIRLARRRSLPTITRREIAIAANSGNGTINYHFGSIGLLRDAALDQAITDEDIEVLARVAGHPLYMRRLSSALRERVAAHIAGK